MALPLLIIRLGDQPAGVGKATIADTSASTASATDAEVSSATIDDVEVSTATVSDDP